MKSVAELGDMNGRVVAVTGGAGHLGRAIATTMLEMGASVALIDQNREALDAAASDLEYYGPVIARIGMDIESEQKRQELPGLLRDAAGRLDCLINNAGFVGDSNLQGWVSPFTEQRIDTWRRAIEVNLTAPFHLSQLLFPLLKESGHGSIINISSIYGVLGPDMSLYEGTAMGNPAAYAASKGGLIQLTRWLATNLAPDIRVNCISPGGLFRNQADSFVQRYEEKTPLRRMGSEEDFAGIIAYLASDLSKWVTGQNIMIDGGWSAW